MRFLKLALPVLVLCAGLLVNTSRSFGKPEYTKKEKKGCTVCHVKANSKDLNDVGKCYEKKKSLQGCVTP